jgi:hypothetical protein
MYDHAEVPANDLPDSDAIYARYLETCRRLHVAPVSRERAGELVDEWNQLIRSPDHAAPTKH